MAQRERRRAARLEKKAALLWGAGRTRTQIASDLNTSEETVEKLLRPLGVPGRVRDEKFETKRGRTDMTIPKYTDDPFWEPGSVEEAAELAGELGRHGVDPAQVSGTFGDYANLTADLPWVTSPFEPVADLSDESAALDLALAKGGYTQWSYGAGLADSDLIRLWETRNSGEEFARTCGDLESRGYSVELSSEEPAVEVSDQELWRHYEDVKSGEAGRRRARRAVEDKFEERLAYWREAAKRGEVLPRDLEGLI